MHFLKQTDQPPSCPYRNFNSPYIVKLLGICIDADPICIIMELMPGGDLLHFLRDAKQDFVRRLCNNPLR